MLRCWVPGCQGARGYVGASARSAWVLRCCAGCQGARRCWVPGGAGCQGVLGARGCVAASARSAWVLSASHRRMRSAHEAPMGASAQELRHWRTRTSRSEGGCLPLAWLPIAERSLRVFVFECIIFSTVLVSTLPTQSRTCALDRELAHSIVNTRTRKAELQTAGLQTAELQTAGLRRARDNRARGNRAGGSGRGGARALRRAGPARSAGGRRPVRCARAGPRSARSRIRAWTPTAARGRRARPHPARGGTTPRP